MADDWLPEPPPGPDELTLEQQYHEADCGAYADRLGDLAAIAA